MAKTTVNLVKAVYLAVNLQRYYVSIDGGTLTEVSEQVYERYLNSGVTVQQSSEKYQDRTMIYRSVEIL